MVPGHEHPCARQIAPKLRPTAFLDGRIGMRFPLHNPTVPGRVFGDETFDIGQDTGMPVNRDYDVPFAFTGDVHRVVVELKPA